MNLQNIRTNPNRSLAKIDEYELENLTSYQPNIIVANCRFFYLIMCLPSLTTTVWITTVSLHIASNLSILNSKPQLFELSIFRMSNWNSSDLEAEDYDPNKDYSVQVQRKDGGLASTQVAIHETSYIFICFLEMFAKNC